MNLQETIRRILREELSPRVRRRIPYDEMEKEFLESFESAYYNRAHSLDGLIYLTISMMMDGIHWMLTSTLPEDEFWYDDIHTELENHYRDRIIQMYNERQGINESILKEEIEVPAFLRRRFSPEDLDWLVNDVKEMIDYGESLDTAIYDGIREFVKSRKFADIDEFGVEADYWESYLRYERPLVDYVKKKLRITDNVNESILREETQIPLPIIRRVTNSDIEESFLISLDRIDDERRYSKMSVMKNISLQTFAKMVIDDMVTELEFGYFSDENRIYFDNDETYHDEIRVPLMNYFADKIKKRYSEFID